MVEPISLGIAIGYLVKSAPSWFHSLQDTFFSKGKELAIEQGKQRLFEFFDEKKHLRHMELALKNAAERGLKQFDTPIERDIYRSILEIVSEDNSGRLRQEAMQLFTLSDNPDLTALSEKYNLSKRISALAHRTTHKEVDATPYLHSFFDALIAELYNDPMFQEQMSSVLKVRAALKGQRSLEEIIDILNRINQQLSKGYSLEQLKQDLDTYAEYIDDIYRHHEFVGIVLKGDEDAAPELNAIFVPLRITLREPLISTKRDHHDIIPLLERSPYLVLLGGPGSGKSTITRYLAWCHAKANNPHSPATHSSNGSFLSGKPMPLRIELRRLVEARRQRLDYSFLSYATEVLLAREGIGINTQMFITLLERRAMLVLFDGLDEVPTLDERRELIAEIERFARRYPGNRILVTSRPVGYDIAPFTNRWFKHGQIREFDDRQIHNFLIRWYRNVLKDNALFSETRQELESFYGILINNPRLHTLAKTPLLLTVMTAVHRYERLPNKRVQVYERCADLLLDKWVKLKGVDARWKEIKMSKDDQCACVAHLGLVLHECSQDQAKDEPTETRIKSKSVGSAATDVPARFLKREIERYIHSQNLFPSGAEQHMEAERFLELIKVEAGLIVERGTNENGEALYGFVHRTFQEYFAATSIYNRYLDEGATIISVFLEEHLHDPHWSEVILLLFSKLSRKLATAQLQQILEGSSSSSLYSNLVKQDLFFVCDCLAEDINVENAFAERITSLLSEVITKSPFPSQRRSALQVLATWIRTLQYAELGWRTLKMYVSENKLLDTTTSVDIVRTLLSIAVTTEDRLRAKQLFIDWLNNSNLPLEQLIDLAGTLIEAEFYWNSPEGSLEEQELGQLLLAYAQRPDLPSEQLIKLTETLYEDSSERSPEKKRAFQLLLAYTQRPDLSLEQLIDLAETLYRYSSEGSPEEQKATQLLLAYTQRPDLSLEQLIDLAETLYRICMEGIYEYDPEMSLGKQAAELLLACAQRPDLPSEQSTKLAKALYAYSSKGSLEKQQAAQLLLAYTQRSDLSFEQLIKLTETLYRYSPEGSPEEQKGLQLLLDCAQRPDLSLEQLVDLVEALYRYSPEGSPEEQKATQLLLAYTQRPDLSLEQLIDLAKTLYRNNEEEIYWKNSEELLWKHLVQLLLAYTQRPVLSLEQLIDLAETLYRYSPERLPETQQIAQLLLAYTQRPVLSLEQLIDLAKTLYRYSPRKSPERQSGFQLLLACTQRPDLSLEQLINLAEILYRYSPRKSPERQSGFQLLLACTQRPDLPSEQLFKLAETLSKSRYSGSPERQHANRLLLACAQRPDLPSEQHIKFVKALYRYSSSGSPERQQSLQIIRQLMYRQDISVEQRLSVAITPLTLFEHNYADRAEAVRMVCSLIEGEAAKALLSEKWTRMSDDAFPPDEDEDEVPIADIPSIFELACQDILPTEVRDEMYQSLRSIVPQFRDLKVASE